MKRNFRQRLSFGKKLGLSTAHATKLAKLSTPEKIQDFISALDVNREKGGDTCLSAAETLRVGHAHCIEGAFVAATALWMSGAPPMLMDLQAKGDDDHVVTLFRVNGCWGAISKSNHLWLRWRDPVYRSLRELAMSYFHEYVTSRNKTMHAYSVPFDLRRFDPAEWVTNKDDCWDVAATLDDCRHYKVLTPGQARSLKPPDAFQVKIGKITEH